MPIKVAVMGCIVNGPGEAEGADVAVFAGDRRGIIYVQGEKVANVPEAEILDRLLPECKRFEARVLAGEATLGQKVVNIVPPDPIGELGSGVEKIRPDSWSGSPSRVLDPRQNPPSGDSWGSIQSAGNRRRPLRNYPDRFFDPAMPACRPRRQNRHLGTQGHSFDDLSRPTRSIPPIDPRGRGFTIVEVLAVVGIIAALMGLILAGLQAAGRTTARPRN